MKKLFAVILTLSLLAALTGCNASTADSSASESSVSESSASEAADLSALTEEAWVYYIPQETGSFAYELTLSPDGSAIFLAAVVQGEVTFYATGTYTVSGDVLSLSVATEADEKITCEQKFELTDTGLTLTLESGDALATPQLDGDAITFAQKHSAQDEYAHIWA